MMRAVLVNVALLGLWASGVLLGWLLHGGFGARRDNLRYYRMGLKNGIFVRAKVVMRQIRREKKEAK